MHEDIAAVLAGNSKYACVCHKAEVWFGTLPDDSIDLIVCSPPYMGARTYGINFNMKAEEWSRWMMRIIRAASPKCKGLIAINCEGQTIDWEYQPAPFLLIADLYRAGYTLRKPAAFHRIGIPGSGGTDFFRNDWEPVICVTRGGKLPWSDNTACGHPPKWAPGGEMSNRNTDGTRANSATKKNAMGVQIDRHVGTRPETGSTNHSESETYRAKNFQHAEDGTVKGSHERDIVAIANPGNTIQVMYTADEVAELLAEATNFNHHIVGGNVMGHPLAHKNEAPFPTEFAERYVKSFCPPGGVVADCFSGSGTTAHVAYEHGRRFIGCDTRQSQVDLMYRRLQSITPSMFITGAEDE